MLLKGNINSGILGTNVRDTIDVDRKTRMFNKIIFGKIGYSDYKENWRTRWISLYYIQNLSRPVTNLKR